ncbi:MAG: M90 family metallopeptidase [Bacteroidia bacterium]
MIETASLIIFLVFVWLMIKASRSRWRGATSKSRETLKPGWKEILEDKVRFYQRLEPEEKKEFEAGVLKFLRQCTITGIKTKVTDEDRILVAASAVIPLFRFPDWEYRNINEVLLYPDSFAYDYDLEGDDRSILGMVGTGTLNNKMILSRPSLRKGFGNKTDKHNVAIHEFVHLLDKADGSTDGIPEYLMDKQYIIPWLKLMRNEIKAVQEGDSDIHPYGSTSEAEFFSVVSEYFFERPNLFERKHPELYRILEKIYRLDSEQ